MPGKIKVKVLAGRNLPVMDKSGDTTDGYVELKFGTTIFKTDVARKTLNPQWNSEWYKFEVDDAELQDEPLQIRLMDYDTYSANDAIGKIYINLNPLLLPGLPLPVKNMWTLEATMNSSTGSQGGDRSSVMTGWIPVFDTMHGIRGEVNIIIKVELFSDFNKFKQSSCGVQFFYSPNIPHGYHAQVIHGFVEELIISDDPEYKWIDKIRTPRASNEARQILFLKLSGEIQRKIGLKALDLGGNAVIGYIQTFDLEGESGIVARGIGTAVTLVKLHDTHSLALDGGNVDDLACFSLQNKTQLECYENDDIDSVPLLSCSPSHSPVSRSPVKIHRTHVGNKFPINEKSLNNVRSTTRITEFKASTIKTRMMSLQNSQMGNIKKNLGVGSNSTLSLSDDLICESSLRSMLALEDMRGERTSAFSRGLKNLRYLPKRVIQIKSRFSDSYDDESDQDSNYSSSWSIIGGSDSTRSSITDLRQSIRRKKFTHKRNSSEATGSMAALLIRSVHTGFPLDSVTEDRETPTPSPVHFLDNHRESIECLAIPINCLNDPNLNDIIPDNANAILTDSDINKNGVCPNEKDKSFNYNDKNNIPMISSSETDTSTSDDDEPSESSTNYNIIDDSYSTIESSIESGTKLTEKNSLNAINSDKSIELDTIKYDSSQKLNNSETDDNNYVYDLLCDNVKSNEAISKIFDDNIVNSESNKLNLNFDTVTDDYHAPLITSTFSVSNEKINNQNYSTSPSIASLLRTSPTKKLKILSKQKSFDKGYLTFPNATSTPIDEKNDILHLNANLKIISSSNELSSSIEPYMRELLIPIIDSKAEQELLNDEQNYAPIKFDEKKVEIVSIICKRPILPQKNMIKLDNKIVTKHESKNSINSTPSPLPYKKYLMHSGSLENKSSSRKKEKTTKKVTRTETVIYKGPMKDKEKPEIPMNHTDINEKSIKTSYLSSANKTPTPKIVIAPPSEPDCYLRIPMSDTKTINAHSPCSQNDTKVSTNPVKIQQQTHHDLLVEPQYISERFIKKYRQHCMHDLIKTIDAKMMIHTMHNERKDSTKSKKKRREHGNINSTPSPDSIHKLQLCRKNSRSKSPPERHHHRHHHHHHHHHNPSNQSHQISSSAIHTSNNSTHIPNTSTYPLLKSLKEIDASFILNPNEIDMSVHKSHSETSLGKMKKNQLPLTCITNNANNIIDDVCVPCLPIPLRQQAEQQQHQQQHQLLHQSTSPLHPSSSSTLAASVGSKAVNSPANKPPLHRRSSDSDLSITPKGNSLAGSDRSMAGYLRPSTAIRTMNQDALEMLEYPFITIQQYPPGFILNLGGLVSARSVKLIEKLNNLEEPEGRDAWWTEIRMEVRSHARALGCNVVLGYKEEISVCDDVCVLNASGTAAVINLLNSSQEQDVLNRNTPATIMTSVESDKCQQKSAGNKSEKIDDNQIISAQQPQPQQLNNPLTGKITRISESNNDNETPPNVPLQNSCNYCHLPYSETSVPFKVDVSKCAVCRRAKVPDVLFTTIELPENIPITGRGVFIQAIVCKCKRDLRGELNAKEISDCLPFLEYEMHSLLLNKLKVKGMNAIFGLRVQISIGERLIVGMAVGTAVFLTALPTPLIPQIASGNAWHNDEKLAEIQRALIETVKRNRELYYLKSTIINNEIENGKLNTTTTSDTDESDDDLPDLDLGVGTKDACVLEVDDVEDMDRINLLIDETSPNDFHVVNTQTIPGLDDLEIVRNLQMFTQVSRAKIPSGQHASMPSKYFARMLQTVFFKLRRMVPCALCDMQFKVALTDQDEIQLSVVGMALGLGEPTKLINKYKRNNNTNNNSNINNKAVSSSIVSKNFLKTIDDNDMIFKLDEDQGENMDSTGETSINQQAQQQLTTTTHPSPIVGQIQRPLRSRSPLKLKAHSPHRHKHVPLKESYGVDITPLSYLPGGRIERYLGNLNFFFIRECTSIRENGGLSGFTHSFITEVLAICRAHITALGGNAMVAFFMTQCELVHSPHKNQGQCLINVGGDVVSVSYFSGERHNQNC